MKTFWIFIACLLFSVSAFAQNTADIHYVNGSLENISDALFKKGILKIDDPAAIEEYIRIHHCGMYEQYQRDDFSWSRIREGQARDLAIRMPTMADGLEIANIVYLTQYDMANNQFTLNDESVLNNVGTLTAFNDPSGFLNVCDHPFVPRVHPTELIIKLDQPLSMTGIPMNHSMADTLLGEMNSRIHLADKERRTALMVFRVRITGPDPMSVASNTMHRTVLGQLDDIRVYEGPNRKILLFTKTFGSPLAKAGKN